MIDESVRGQFGCGVNCGRLRSCSHNNCICNETSGELNRSGLNYGYLWIVDATLVENESFERGNSGNRLGIADGIDE